MNPYDRLYMNGLSGLDGLDGLGSKLKKLKNKVKKVVRKVGKVVAPIVVGVVAGPAAGAAVAQQVLKHNKEKKEAKAAAKEMGVEWGVYKQGEAAIEKALAEKAAKEAQNPALAPYAQEAIHAIDQFRNNPATARLTEQMLAQGYTPQQIEHYFMTSQPVKNAVNSAVAAGTYDYYTQRGVPDAIAASTAVAAGKEAEKSLDNSIDTKTLLSIGIPAALLLLS